MGFRRKLCELISNCDFYADAYTRRTFGLFRSPFFDTLHADMLGDETYVVDLAVVLVCLSGPISGCAVSAALQTVVGNAHLHLWTHCLVIDNSTGQMVLNH
jgi:hypothetical protein